MDVKPTYYELNKEKMKMYQNEYYQKNRRKCLEKQKEYYKNHLERKKEYYNDYYYPVIKKNKIAIERMKQFLAELEMKRQNKLKDSIIISL